MDMFQIQSQFLKMGARAVVHPPRESTSNGVSIDIGQDRDGEFFDISAGKQVRELLILDVQRKERHLLLMARHDGAKSKFLCGHDERHWFVAAVPEASGASMVQTAFEALRPAGVRVALLRHRVKPKARNRRRNDAFKRQGEWFFVPTELYRVDLLTVLSNEPLRRGSGKPHICDELVRAGGQTVYVADRFPNGLTERQYSRLMGRSPELRHLNWRTMKRDPDVYVRGRVRHADHKTIYRDGWHRVLMNTETQAAAMRHVAFLD